MKIVKKSVTELVQGTMAEYGQELLLNRSFPSYEDGLKPSHRAVMLSMLANKAMTKFVDGSMIVGGTKAFHDHGELSVAGAIISLAEQRSSLLSIDGTPSFKGHGMPTQPRYYKASFSKFGRLLMRDAVYNPEDAGTPFKFRVPYGLLQDQTNIGYRIGANYPAFNPHEILAAMRMLVDHPDTPNTVLAEIIQGIDMDSEAVCVQSPDMVHNLLTTGYASNIISMCRIVKAPGRKQRLMILDMPWQETNKIFKSDRWGAIKGLDMEHLSNLSGANGVEIQIPFSGVSFEELRDEIYSKTSMKKGLAVKLIYKRGNKLDLVPMREIFMDFIAYNIQFITAEINAELAKLAEKRMLYGALEVLTRPENIDRFTPLLKLKTKQGDTVKTFELDPAAVKLVFENNNLNKLSDRDEILDTIAEFDGIENRLRARLTPENLRAETKEYLHKVEEAIGDVPRKTPITHVPYGFSNKKEDAVVESVPCYIAITADNRILRVDDAAQLEYIQNVKWIISSESDSKLGMVFSDNIINKPISTVPYRDKDINDFTQVMEQFKGPITTGAMEYLFLFSSGKIKKLRGSDINFRKSSRTSFNFAEDETIVGVFPSQMFEPHKYLYFSTKQGRLKRVELSDTNVSIIESGGKISCRMDDDEVVDFMLSSKEDFIVGTASGEQFSVEYDEARMFSDPRKRPYDTGIGKFWFMDEGMLCCEGKVIDDTAAFTTFTNPHRVCIL